MGNDLTGNPLIIDTAFNAAEKAQFAGPFHIVSAEWQEPTAADDLTITDNAGTVIYDDNAIAGGSGIRLDVKMNGVVTNGFDVDVIDGGTLYVYIK
jgi:hypothetical protein